MSQEQTDRLEAGLKGLPAYLPPRELADNLRVVASRESLRRRRRVSLEAWWAHFREEMTLFSNNLVRPLAVPFAGGLVSALVLFAALVTGYPVIQQETDDVPTALTTPATLQSSLTYSLYDVVMIVDVSIDAQGRVVDYSIPRDQHWASDPDMVRSVERTLLCTKFNPATRFGRQAAGRQRIALLRSQVVDVRG